MATHLALLRGVNVGGHAKIAMADLRRVFADLGHNDVTTHIQSGNVLFTPSVDPSDLAESLERGIARELGVTTTVLLRTKGDLDRIVRGNPLRGCDADPAKLHVAFLATPPDPRRVTGFEAPPGSTEEFAFADREVFLYYPDGYGRTKLSNAYIERRLGVAATTRNWRVVTKLRELMGD